jgi:hypothetical protein
MNDRSGAGCTELPDLLLPFGVRPSNLSDHWPPAMFMGLREIFNVWATVGFDDTLLRSKMKLEVTIGNYFPAEAAFHKAKVA